MPAGHRPPKKWFEQKLKEVQDGNPSYSDEQARATVGSIWYGLSDYKQNQISKTHEGSRKESAMLTRAVSMLERRGEDGGEDENHIVYKKYGPGKFGDNVEEKVYNDSMDGFADMVGDEFFGIYFAVAYDPPLTVDYDGDVETIAAAIIHENDQGFVYTEYYDTQDKADAMMAKLEKEYAEALEERGEDEDF